MKMKKYFIIFIILGFMLWIFNCTQPGPVNYQNNKNQKDTEVSGPLKASNSDYQTVLKYAVEFYDANRCGDNVSSSNVFNWRGNCHTKDGQDKGINLNGGFHDAGDHVKFGLPQGYSAAVLGWALYEYNDVFASAGVKNKLVSTLKIFTDYFLKSLKDNTFYYQVGEGSDDHAYWGAPEAQSENRPTYAWANSSNPASDVLGVTSAALSLMYLNYKNTNSTYANKCLTAAKKLYNMGKNNLGFSEGQSFYQSNSYYDDLAFAATWLYIIENNSSYKTEINSYLSHETKFGDSPFVNKWTMCWDDMYMAVFVKMAEVSGEQKYKDAMDYNLNYWKNNLNKTPGGLRYLSNWGVLRYASSESLLALLYYKQTGDNSLKNFAKSQIDYILGDNPNNMSYVVGFGSKYPLHPHHRAANGYTYANGDNTKPAKYLLRGALIGGPDQNDNFKDDVNQYQYTEVAIDYNAGFVGALAGLLNGNVTSSSSSSSLSSSSSSSSSSTPRFNIPGTIQAEDYHDYYDTTSGNTGGKYRDDDVDIQDCAEGGYNVGWIANNEWLDYNVDVESSGKYLVELRVAAKSNNIKCNILQGSGVIGSVNTAATGNWQSWKTTSVEVNLSGGNRKIRIAMTGGSWNLNWIKITKVNDTPVGPAGYTYCCMEGESYTFTETVDVAYGANGQFKYENGVTGTITFNNARFGDPIHGVKKAGFYKLSTSSSSSSSSSSLSSSSSSSSSGSYTTISFPFTHDGAGEYYWKLAATPNHINSWNTDLLEINGVDLTNKWKSGSELPPKQGGYYYIHFKGSVGWSHFEAK